MYAFYQKHEYLILSLLIAFSFAFPIQFWDGLYRDTDNFIHAWRVYDLMTRHGWAETLLMKSNYPFGEVIHYTRLMDVLWMLIALPFTYFMPVKQAVFNAGLLFQPFTAVITACALVWALRPRFNAFVRLIAVCLFFGQSISAQLYVFARPDHHTLVTFFTFIIVGCFLHYMKTRNLRFIKAAGIASGLLLWTSVEGLLISYAILAPVLILWIWDGRFLKESVTFSLFYFLSGTICLSLNPPYEGFFHPDNGRVSLLTLCITGLTYASLTVADFVDKKGMLTTWYRRLAAISVPAALSLGVVLLTFGKNTVFGNPFTPEIEAWYRSVAELVSPTTNPFLYRFFAMPSTVAVVLLVLLFKPQEKDFLFLTGFPLLFFAFLTYIAIRFAQHAAVFSVFPCVYGIELLQTRFKQGLPISNRLCGFIILAALILTGVFFERHQVATLQDMQSAFKYDTTPYLPFLSPKEGAVLARVFDGSEIIWTTERPVISTPNHRNIDGIVDTYAIYFGNNMKEVRRLLEKRQITTIFVPRILDNLNPLTPPRPDDFAVRLLEGRDLPCGIHFVPIPAEIAKSVFIYHVNFDNCPSIEDEALYHNFDAREYNNGRATGVFCVNSVKAYSFSASGRQ